MKLVSEIKTNVYELTYLVSGGFTDSELKKVQEEIQELKHEELENNHDRIESEFGDVLFSLVNYSRFIDVNPEDALERTNKRFIKRFQLMEDKIKNDGNELSEISFDQMNEYWTWAKKKYKII